MNVRLASPACMVANNPKSDRLELTANQANSPALGHSCSREQATSPPRTIWTGTGGTQEDVWRMFRWLGGAIEGGIAHSIMPVSVLTGGDHK